MSLSNVLDGDFCIGCGACKSPLGDKVEITIQDSGFYKARVKENLSQQERDAADSICPVSRSSEDELGLKLFGRLQHSQKIGFYSSVKIGYVLAKRERMNSSSGGLTTWFAEKLLLKGYIDSVVHVGAAEGTLFSYTISRNVDELRQPRRKKSRYYPVTFEGLIKYLTSTKDKVLFIGVPCYVKAIRHLQETMKLDCVKFAFSLVCGHMKSTGFAENYGWQMGIHPDSLADIDFRVKKEGHNAGDYFVTVTSLDGKTKTSRNKSLLGSNWGHGYFKHKSCDFCDDLAGELADATFGDAWLKESIKDFQGTNIFISRNQVIDELIEEFKTEIFTQESSAEDFYKSQAANYRHRRDGLPFRIANAPTWTPPCRVYLSESVSSSKRKRLYVFRQSLSRYSILSFAKAKYYNCYSIFSRRMKLLGVYYDYLHLGTKAFLKKLLGK